jgi:hypothetical protein
MRSKKYQFAVNRRIFKIEIPHAEIFAVEKACVHHRSAFMLLGCDGKADQQQNELERSNFWNHGDEVWGKDRTKYVIASDHPWCPGKNN